MATIYINEYSETASANFSREAAAPKAPPLAVQSIAITGTSTQSAAFGSQTKLVEVHVDADCSIDIRLAPSAVSTLWRLSAGETRHYGVTPGDKLAVIN